MVDAIDITNCSLRERRSGLDVPVHRHGQTQWYHCLEGGISVVIGDHEYHCPAGRGILVPPGEPRALRAAAGVTAPSYLLALFHDHRLDLAPAHRRVLAPPLSATGDLADLERELAAVGGPDSSMLISALLTRLLIGLRRRSLAEGAGAPSPALVADGRLVADVEAVMTANLHRQLRRADLALAVGVSEAHLARRWRAITGGTLHRRLVELRLARARTLLAESDLPVTTIALEVGFASFSHFAKVFQEHEGLTPRRWRRRSWGR